MFRAISGPPAAGANALAVIARRSVHHMRARRLPTACGRPVWVKNAHQRGVYDGM
jgi:hypothetical protein